MPLALPGRLVLFDYGNVLTRPQSEEDRAAILALADMPAEPFWAAYWAGRGDLDHGRLSTHDYWAGIGRAGGASWDAGRLQELWAADLRSWTTADPEVVGVLADLHDGGTRLAVLSNAGFDYALLRFSPLAALVERVFLSAELGLSKPDPEIYLHVARALGIPADRVVFVDDKAGNVAGAESAGMTGHVFTGAADLRAFLVRLATDPEGVA